jgi:hypothetical protein
MLHSVAKGPKFRPHNPKGADKIWGQIFVRFVKKSAEKGPNFILYFFSK